MDTDNGAVSRVGKGVGRREGTSAILSTIKTNLNINKWIHAHHKITQTIKINK